jgi:hypothetical protein
LGFTSPFNAFQRVPAGFHTKIRDLLTAAPTDRTEKAVDMGPVSFAEAARSLGGLKILPKSQKA